MVPKLSIIILTHNDEERIVDCLECVKFADEIIVVDDESSDRTVELARQYTKNIFIKNLSGNFSNQRNYALNCAHGNWVMFVDSDEFVSETLRSEILNVISKTSHEGYFVNRIDYMWGRKILHGEVGEVKLLRLARRTAGKWRGKVHERWQIKGASGYLRSPLIHAPHQSILEFVSEVDKYSTIRALELKEEKIKPSAMSILMYPAAKFLRNYFMKKGYKDGVPGFLYAMLMSFHSFLVRAKLYQLENE